MPRESLPRGLDRHRAQPTALTVSWPGTAVPDLSLSPRATESIQTILLGLQRTAGNRAVSAMLARQQSVSPTLDQHRPTHSRPDDLVIQRLLANAAAWDPVEANTGQGQRVVAIIGPGVVMGTKPAALANFRPYEYQQLFSAASKAAQYAQGHLLNENLGGPGNPAAPHAAENLTAFPQWPTNTDHKTVVENKLKNKVKAGRWFRYEVRIAYSQDSMPRLMKRLGLLGPAFNATWQVQTGLTSAQAQYTYASRVTADWQELAQASTDAALVNLAGATPGEAVFDIPNPLSYIDVAKQPLEYPPGHIPGGAYQHMKTFKAQQVWWKAKGGVPHSAGRPHILAERWRGIDAARANTAAPVGSSATYLAGHAHYLEGVTASRLGPAAARYGRGYTMGYADFESGMTHARTNRLAAPPAIHAATLGHSEYWVGMNMALLQLLTNPPLNNRAQIAGHADYWAGVTHAHSNPAASPPAGKLASVDGHTDYWAGVTHALTHPVGQPPAAKLASIEGHKDFWDGVGFATADMTAALPPGPLGKTKGHADFLAGVAHARGNPRATAPAPGNLATTTAFNDYWLGVDHARTNARGVAYPAPSSAAAAGVADWWTGVDRARTDLPTLEGPAPAGGGGEEGFQSYRAGDRKSGG